jgi:uncharacterized membrane protein required for colicin V production
MFSPWFFRKEEHGYMVLRVILVIFGLFSAGIVITFFVSTLRAFRKFKSLNSGVQMKITHSEYYMALVRNFSREELNELGKLTDEEIEYFDTGRDAGLLKKENREKAYGEV